MKKPKKIVSLLLSLFLTFSYLLPISATESSTTKILEEIKIVNEVNIAKYAISFVDSLYDNKNFESGNVITLYDENDNISGYCIDILTNNEHNGYVIIKFSDNEPIVSEFAIHPGIKNPYDQIIENSGLSRENLVFYSVGANEYQVLDQKENIVYVFEDESLSESEFIEYIENYNISTQYNIMETRINETEPVVNYSSLDGWSVVSDSYQGSIKSNNIIPGATSISYYSQNNITSLGKTYGCSVAALSNLMKYYRSRGYTKISSSLSTLYSTLWNYAGTNSSGSTTNGNEPKAAKKYLESLGYSCSYNSFLFTWYSDFTKAINNGKPCIFTYGANFGGTKGGHAVLVLGYTETSSYQYLRIADGWNTYLRYINFNGYSYSRKNGWSFSLSN